MTREDDILEMHDAFNGFLTPVKDKRPDPDMSMKQRKTKKWGLDDPGSYSNRPATEDEVREWAAAGSDLGVILGEGSGVVVFEIDAPDLVIPLLHGLEGLRTPTVESPRGYHLYFRWVPGINGQDLYLPAWNDKSHPLYIGRNHLGSIRGEGQIAILPPSDGYRWLPGLSISECDPIPMPDAIADIFKTCRSIAKKPEALTIVQEGSPLELPSHPQTPVLETVLVNDVNPVLIQLITDEGSPLIPALVRRLEGEGRKVRCPYHPPDLAPSATLWLGDGGWRFVCHHTTPPTNLFISQLGADLLNGYLARILAGDPDPHRHFVTRLDRGKQKARRESWVWLTLVAADVGVINLSSSRLPALVGFTADGERVMQFIDSWGRAYRFTFNRDEFPLARRWLISIVFSLSSTDEKSLAWRLAFREIDNALHHALQQKLLEKAAVGKVGLGGTAALYRLLGGGD